MARLMDADRRVCSRAKAARGYYTSNLYWGLEAVSETAEQAALIALTLDCSQ